MFKTSTEYEEIQTCLKPLLNHAENEPRGKTLQYSTYFPWQVLIISNNVFYKVYTNICN